MVRLSLLGAEAISESRSAKPGAMDETIVDVSVEQRVAQAQVGDPIRSHFWADVVLDVLYS
jgi:hypothetical protein